jgi:1-acyl-sn-glycerol-3-phosphate acyltransferase
MLRSIWYLVCLVGSTIWYGLKVVGAALVFRIPQRKGGVYDEAARRWGRKQLAAARVTVSTVGFEHVPRDRPVVFVSNHQSWFDILALASLLPHSVRFVSKKELATIPVLGQAMRNAGHIFIDRENRQRAFGAYEEASRVIRGGMSAVVFVEGTRSRTGNLLPFKKGPFVLAIAAQVPVVPVYCAGTFEIMPKGTMWVRPRPVTVLFGEPIATEGLAYDDREKLLRQVRAVIEEMRDRYYGRVAPTSVDAPKPAT